MRLSLLAYVFIILFSTCNSGTPREEIIKKEGVEDDLIEQYMMDLTANPKTQDQKDQNEIVDFLIDKGWDFQRTDSGIYYDIETLGTQGYPKLSSEVICHYRGTLLSGKEFDASYKKGKPLKFTLDMVVAGWQEVIPMLQKGGRGTFIVPSGLAYGNKGRGGLIKPNSVLMFEIELIDFQ